MKTFAYALPLAFALAGTAHAQTMTSADYVVNAGASDAYEIQSSQTVLQTTKNPKVRSFAQMMVRDHAKTTAKLRAAAMTAKIKTKPAPTPAQTDMLAQLKAQTGPARDQAYITQQKQAHGQALALHKAYASDGTNVALKSVAKSAVPVVQHHMEMLQTM